METFTSGLEFLSLREKYWSVNDLGNQPEPPLEVMRSVTTTVVVMSFCLSLTGTAHGPAFPGHCFGRQESKGNCW